MDLSDPTRAVTSSLDGAVLAALAGAGRPLTAGEIAGRSARGSEIGIRKCLARLVDEGLVRAVEMGRNRVHELNRDHIAAPVAELLAGLRLVLIQRLKQEIASWSSKPLEAWLYGSAARGDGNANSDIDVLLIRKPRPAEERFAVRAPRSTAKQLLDWVNTPPADPPFHFSRAEEAAWTEQTDVLRERVFAWTGNEAQIVDLSTYELERQDLSSEGLYETAKREGVALIETGVKAFIRSFVERGGRGA